MKTSILLSSIVLATAAISRADHGPGTSGSGAFTESAETLKPRQWSLSGRFDWTEFDVPADVSLAGKGHFDLLDRSFLTTFNLSVGVTENFQLGLGFGYYAAEGSREIEHDHEDHAEAGHEEAGEGGEHEHPEHADRRAAKPQFSTFDPDGWTDLWLTGKQRLYRGPSGQFAIYGGVKLPIGETRVINSAGERVEPAATPGTGAWDGMIGAAYTQALTPDLAIDVSAQYTFRGEKFAYRLGNRLDAGAALGWRIIGAAKTFPQVSLQAEANVRSVSRSKAQGVDDENTGGTVLFLSPGARIRFTEHAALSVGVQLPILQDLNGDQLETAFRFTSSVNISF
jgi:hypothetical protein